MLKEAMEKGGGAIYKVNSGVFLPAPQIIERPLEGAKWASGGGKQ